MSGARWRQHSPTLLRCRGVPRTKPGFKHKATLSVRPSVECRAGPHNFVSMLPKAKHIAARRTCFLTGETADRARARVLVGTHPLRLQRSDSSSRVIALHSAAKAVAIRRGSTGLDKHAVCLGTVLEDKCFAERERAAGKSTSICMRTVPSTHVILSTVPRASGSVVAHSGERSLGAAIGGIARHSVPPRSARRSKVTNE